MIQHPLTAHLTQPALATGRDGTFKAGVSAGTYRVVAAVKGAGVPRSAGPGIDVEVRAVDVTGLRVVVQRNPPKQ